MRFSLRSLLGVMTLAAVASFALFTDKLYPDESTLLLGWTVGTYVGLCVGQIQRNRLILACAVCGSLGSLIACFLTPASFLSRLRLSGAEQIWCVVPAGFVIAGGVGAIYHVFTGAAPSSARALRWRRINRCAILAVAGLTPLTIVFWKASEWSPRIELIDPETLAARTHPDSKYIRAISSQGNLVAVETRNDWYGSNHKALDIYRVEQRRLLPIKIAALGDGDGPVDFSPDETWIAFYDRPTKRMLVADVVGGASNSALMDDAGDRGCERLTVARDGKQIVACWKSEQFQLIETLDKEDIRSVNEQRFEFHGEMRTSPAGKWLVKYASLRPSGPGVYGSPELVLVEVLRAADQQVVGYLEQLTSSDLPIFSAQETEVAFLDRIISLAKPLDGKAVATTVPGTVVGFLGKDRLLLIVDSQRTFQTRLPFLRHWFPMSSFKQLCIYDRSKGVILRRSKQMEYIGDIHLARNGKVAAAIGYYNTLEIWDVPQID